MDSQLPVYSDASGSGALYHSTPIYMAPSGTGATPFHTSAIEACKNINPLWDEMNKAVDELQNIHLLLLKANNHYETAHSTRKDLESLSKPLGLLVFNRKKREKELKGRMEAEIKLAESVWDEVAALQARFLDFNYHSLMETLDRNLTLLFDAFIKMPLERDEKQAMKENSELVRTVREVRTAVEDLPKHMKARWLLESALDEAKSIQVSLIEQYNDYGNQVSFVGSGPVDSGDGYIPADIQKLAVQTSKSLEGKIAAAVSLDSTIPAHTSHINITMDPNKPYMRQRSAIVIQNAVMRLDDTIRNLKDSLAYLEAKITKCREVFKVDLPLMEDCLMAVYKRGQEGLRRVYEFEELDSRAVDRLKGMAGMGVVLKGLL
ncbi:hypothetical protein HDU97_002810 [Phlyctochytrium planicorne]|nr:hypothetical protein HDU97_002810 [Phlyctochytrium planicorne]